MSAQGNALGTGHTQTQALKWRNSEGHHMPQSLSKIAIHLVFTTKNRQPVLGDNIRDELHRYMGGILTNMESPALAIGSVADHVHVLCLLSRNVSVAKLVEQLKTGTSKWLKTKGEALATFYWQSGYGAFSVSESNMDQVKAYIANQAEHHRKTSFQDEYRVFLRKHNIDYDERYVWD
jgi:REP element-mobilizing transposase RayT